jgi:hypothetical protein
MLQLPALFVQCLIKYCLCSTIKALGAALIDTVYLRPEL